jgi:hypothetical protein
MGYKIEFNETLLPGWEAWTGNGITDIPAKNITMNNGDKACLLVDHQGVGLYKADVDQLNVDVEEGEAFVDFSETGDGLEYYLSPELIEECKTVLEKTQEREASFA